MRREPVPDHVSCSFFPQDALYWTNLYKEVLIYVCDPGRQALPAGSGKTRDDTTMEDTLKRLLATEKEANRITELASNADQLAQEATEQARSQEQRFQARLPELRASFLDKADQRAAQALKEIQRRTDERLEQLRQNAEDNAESALEAAFAELLRHEGT